MSDQLVPTGDEGEADRLLREAGEKWLNDPLFHARVVMAVRIIEATSGRLSKEQRHLVQSGAMVVQVVRDERFLDPEAVSHATE